MTAHTLVTGVGMTRFGRLLDCDLRTLAEQAANAALADAGISARQIQMVFAANTLDGLLEGQAMISGQAALRRLPFAGAPMVNVENACASSSTAFRLACLAVGSGEVEHALVLGFEKMTHSDRHRSLLALASAIDLNEFPDVRRQFQAGILHTGPWQDRGGDIPTHSVFMDHYAVAVRDYVERTGATIDDLVAVTVKNHANAAMNPCVQDRGPLDAAAVRRSRPVSPPLTALMCSPITDGAAALVVSRCDPTLTPRSVKVLSCAMVSGGGDGAVPHSALQRASAEAYARAGLGPNDIDLAEVHDAVSPLELSLCEQLGLCQAGEGVELLRSGATSTTGSMPLNTSGGLVGRGHAIAATGAAQLVELVTQLRGEAGARQVARARTALAHNDGGDLTTDPAATVVTILQRPSGNHR